jgi:hypothetical protein
MQLPVLATCGILAAGACASIPEGDVQLRPGAADVTFLSSQVEPSGCTRMRSVTVQDGCMGSGAGSAREGSRDRVLSRLRNQTVRAGGNTVRIDRESTHLATDSPESGSVVTVEATIFACSGT